ncbi:CoxG family protein [Pseudonocardia sp. N23]|uniref:CoxG family protein n=1 Tax=Pseudonocardia sp. N23 TaxID=1987376 RepID=UPI000C029923|nr:SRPBCC family protein [Pseudonocardia sp. N23]GAY08049.1 cyclase [Pseudonocardia sp. N23]
MHTFSTTRASEIVVAADRDAIWDTLTDPGLLARLTPLLRRIDADGDVWRWHMSGVSVLGVGISPSFTEKMAFDPRRRIGYAHSPPPGTVERTGADGWYSLDDAPGGTRLGISLTLRVELPLARVTAPAVVAGMNATLQRTGDRFTANLLRHLGAPSPDRT